MAIEFNCSQCSSELKVRDEDRGKKARCPRCGMIHEVPGGNTASADFVTVEDEPQPDAQASETDPAEQETVYQDPDVEQRFRIDDRTGRWSMKTPDGRVFGPVHRTELDEWAAQGRISAQCLVQLDGQSHWQSALVLYPNLANVPVRRRRESSVHSRSRSRSRSHSHSRSRHDHVGTQRRRPRQPRPNSGVTVLVLAIVGIFFIMFPVFSLMAWVLGASERRSIEAGEALPSGRWMLDLGYYLGIVLTIIGVVIILGCYAIIPF